MSQKYKIQTRASEERVKNRANLLNLFKTRPMADEELLINLGLFMRSGALAKLLFLDEIYRMVLPIPGQIIEFGNWWGQSLVVFENLRAVHEPYNIARRIVGFDTFAGYPSVGDKDRASETIKVGGYETSSEYPNYLNELLTYHEAENGTSRHERCSIVHGDAIETVPAYFSKNKHALVALAFFDMALYTPTKVCIQAILPRMPQGAIMVFDELNDAEYPGETEAFLETMNIQKHEVFRSKYLPDRTIVRIGRA